MARGSGALDTYRAKRSFKETPEPKGRLARRKGNAYLIQKHDATRLHYDFRLELDGVLKSWAVTRGPSLNPADKRLAVRTEDHPVDYGSFEGTIPEGHYGAGTVMLWDTGTWEPLEDPHKGLEEGKLKFALHGQRLKGAWALVRMKPKKKEKRENWLLIKDRDEAADRKGDITRQAETSIVSGRAMSAIAKDLTHPGDAAKKAKARKRGGKLPGFAKPMLATLVEDVPEGDNWVYEVKFDGYRIQAALNGPDVRLYTRNGLDWTDKFGRLPRALADLDLDGALLDGEVAAVSREGRTDFSALQKALSEDGRGVESFVFDLLAEGGRSLRGQTLLERKKRLKRLLAKAPRNGPVFYSDHVEGGGKAMLAELCAKGFEGIIAKRADATYRAGRGKSWLKIKCDKTQEFVIVGWRPSERDRPFASILLAQNVDGALVYAGRAGSGFDGATLDDLAARFRTLSRKTAPLKEVPAEIAREARWVRPELVAQIALAGFTGDGMVCHGRYLGLREDKPAAEVKPERPDPGRGARTMKKAARNAGDEEAATVAGVRLTHPDRMLFPSQDITKRELAEYLAAAAPRMLPYLADRLVSLVRCPEGRTGQCFFQRHGGKGFPETFDSLAVEQKNGETEDYLYIADRKALVNAAQVGVLEFHVWGSRIDRIERPERIVFDLDPDTAVGFPAVKRAAADMRQALDALGLESFPLLTGGKGIHVVVPIERRHDWPVITAFARALAQRFEEQAPSRYVATMSKAKRKDRIFIDHFRNQRGATAIAPYSPRAREGAPLAWPVSWKALEEIATPRIVTVASAAERLKERDPWAGYTRLRQTLRKAALDALDVDPG
jgi:bifunctional non-homologous end joining protein LigD